ncbi:DNA primase [Aquabacterium sp.]|uniref:DNA primase n=1 Tax=Aquabacterium sp. TaxID=1872578 RepID=UPI002C93F395|nr:DNA primase [Aquabacterium sp.]HSW05666.1 DNA primase [Aquabacterium sp.]
MVLPQGFIQDLLARVDIVEVVGRQVDLKKAGINHKGLCPFHGEKTPSFIVSPSRQTYHCFGCGAHGDAIRFITEQTGIGFMDAVRDLAQQAGLQVPEDSASPEDRARAAQEREQRAGLSDLLAKAGEHYRQALKASPRAIDYLKRRGLSGAIAARFGLGYAPDGWRTLASVFPRYDDPQLAEAGLVIVQGLDEGLSEAEQKRYDRFRDRIMFPIRSVRGEVIGFGGRVLDQGEPKYLNSPETPVFHKGQELYGLYEARQALRDKGYALVVEGYMDVVALAQWDFPNAVATLGTACTAEHVAKLFRFTDSVVFSFDGDAAGRRAAARALEAALPHATDLRTIRFLFLPAEHDPDSYVRELGPEAFDKAVAQAVPLSAQLMVHAATDCDLATAEGRSKMLSQAQPLIALLPDGLLREQLVSELAQRGGVALEVLGAHWARRAERAAARRQRDDAGAGPATPQVRARPMSTGRAPPQTATLLDRAAWLLAQHAGVWLDLSADDHEFLAGQPAPYAGFFAALERVVHDHGPVAMAALLDELERDADAESQRPLLTRIRGFHEVDDEDPRPLMASVLHRLRLRAVADELNWLMESGSELSDAATARRQQLLDLQSAMKKVPLGTV